MAAPPNTDWKAYENRMPPLDETAVPFYVIGQVETNNGAIQPVLKEADPQGINPVILILDLTLERVGDVGTEDVAYREARYDAKIAKGQYTSVTIRFEGDDIASAEVEVLH